MPSLVDPEGYFWADASLASRHAAPAEVEIEVRAQLDRAFQAGIRATHIDSHMFVLFKTHALFAVLVRAAHDYGIPFPVPPSMTCNTHTSVLLRDQVVGLTALLQANPNMHPQNWKRDYLYGLATLRPGLSELIVHLGYSNSELLEITEGRSAWGAEWRQRDFDVLMDPGFREVLAKNEISLVGWKNLKKCRTSTW